jgi:uncharacterized protein involved in exopolysaccharide biosynthesis
MPEPELDWNWTDAVAVVWARRYLIVAVTVGAGVAAVLLALVTPRTYLATLTIRIGRVMDRPIQDPAQAMSWTRTAGFASVVHKRGFTDIPLDSLLGNLQAVPAVEGQITPYLSLQVRAAGADRAARLARAAGEVVLEDHRRRYQTMLESQQQYRESLRQQLTAIQQDLKALEESLRQFRVRPTVEAPAVLLMQAQLEDRQSQVLQFTRELRDLEVGLGSQSEQTQQIGDVVLPRSEMRPRRRAMGVAGAAAGALLALFWVIATAGAAAHAGPRGGPARGDDGAATG